jgi:hypothetical protein
MDGVSRVEITAATLYEAVAHALVALRRSEWVAGIAHGSISVADVRVEQEVKPRDFTTGWKDGAVFHRER